MLSFITRVYQKVCNFLSYLSITNPPVIIPSTNSLKSTDGNNYQTLLKKKYWTIDDIYKQLTYFYEKTKEEHFTILSLDIDDSINIGVCKSSLPRICEKGKVKHFFRHHFTYRQLDFGLDLDEYIKAYSPAFLVVNINEWGDRGYGVCEHLSHFIPNRISLPIFLWYHDEPFYSPKISQIDSFPIAATIYDNNREDSKVIGNFFNRAKNCTNAVRIHKIQTSSLTNRVCSFFAKHPEYIPPEKKAILPIDCQEMIDYHVKLEKELQVNLKPFG